MTFNPLQLDVFTTALQLVLSVTADALYYEENNYTMSQKSVYILKKLEPIIIVFDKQYSDNPGF